MAYPLHPILLAAASLACLAAVAPGRTPAQASPSAAGSASFEQLSAKDRVGLRAAREAARYALSRVAEGHEAHNPGQAWRTRFDGRGFLTVPDGGGWSWGLELVRYGFAGAERRVTRPLRVETGGERLAYTWDEDLEEWYRNGRSGLEHGYSLLERPPCADPGALTFTLAVRGGLAPRVAADGRGVEFLNQQGAVVLRYVGLHVFDADGLELEARFERSGEELRLSIEERDARYPLTIDPTAQQAYLKASNTDAIDSFGWSVAISSDTIAVGAPLEESNATGVNGLELDNSAAGAGAVYVFVRSGATWSQEAYIKASNTDQGDSFGATIALSGDTLVVGATGEDSNGLGPNGNPADNSLPNSGAAYVFVRGGTTWTQQGYLKASNPAILDGFGYSVAVSGDSAVVGALAEDSAATGVDGNQSDNSAPASGAAYVFVRSGMIWSQQAYLKASNTDDGDTFGWDVDIDGDTLVVGATSEDSDASGVNGAQGNAGTFIPLSYDAGAAYVFVRNGTSWSQQAYLKASNSGLQDAFGHAVTVSGDSIAIGAPEEDSSAIGVGGDQLNDVASVSGAAYVFVRSGTGWSQQAYVKASNTDADDRFGLALALSGDSLLVGARWESSAASGLNGDQSDDSASRAGAAYLFERSSASWSQVEYLKASNTEAHDWFGAAVALSGSSAVIGAFTEDSASPGVDGDQSDNSAQQAGAAYAFELDPPPPVGGFCFGDGSGAACSCGNSGAPGHGCANSSSSGGALLTFAGTATVANDTLVLAVGESQPNQPGLFFQGDDALAGGFGLLFGDGLRCAGGSVVRLQVVTADAAGNAASSIVISTKGGVGAGQTKRYQWWYRDPLGSPCGSGFNLSNGVQINWN